MQGEQTSCEPSAFDEFDKAEGYLDEELDRWSINRQALYYIYHYAIHIGKCSYAECLDLELGPFIDFLCIEYNLRKQMY